MQKQTSTQKFTEIIDIRESVVILEQNLACLVIEVYSTNFTLLSKEEQDAKIVGFASFLNSLTFPIQILVNNRRVDISAYIKTLEIEIHKIKDPLIITYMENYRNFIQQLVKENTVLDKKFFLVLPFSYLEGTISTAFSTTVGHTALDDFFLQAKAALNAKAEGLRTQLQRLKLQTKILEKEELIKLFHDLYNQEVIVNPEEHMSQP